MERNDGNKKTAEEIYDYLMHGRYLILSTRDLPPVRKLYEKGIAVKILDKSEGLVVCCTNSVYFNIDGLKDYKEEEVER